MTASEITQHKSRNITPHIAHSTQHTAHTQTEPMLFRDKGSPHLYALHENNMLGRRIADDVVRMLMRIKVDSQLKHISGKEVVDIRRRCGERKWANGWRKIPLHYGALKCVGRTQAKLFFSVMLYCGTRI